jgi:hypothetical protein
MADPRLFDMEVGSHVMTTSYCLYMRGIQRETHNRPVLGMVLIAIAHLAALAILVVRALQVASTMCSTIEATTNIVKSTRDRNCLCRRINF